MNLGLQRHVEHWIEDYVAALLCKHGKKECRYESSVVIKFCDSDIELRESEKERVEGKCFLKIFVD